MSSPTKAELAELFNLLTSARSRPTTSDNDTSMDVRDDAKRLNKMASQPVQPREVEQRPRRNTVASILAQKDTNIDFDATMLDTEDTTDRESLADFSRADAKKYPFAFKLPIYKLYKKDDWAKTVRETLERSKDRFKPLAEQVVYAGAKANRENEVPVGKDGGAVRFRVPAAPPTGGRARRGSVVGGRQRSTSTTLCMFPAAQSPGAGVPPQRSAYPRSPAVQDRPEVRALKKRCVGRRRSMTVLQGEEKPRGSWVYNSAVSASERPAAATFAAFPPAPPASPTAKSAVSKYGPMLGVKNVPSALKGAAGHKRRVSDGGPAMLAAHMMMPLGQVAGRDRLVARRRAPPLDLEDEGCEAIERKQANRTF